MPASASYGAGLEHQLRRRQILDHRADRLEERDLARSGAPVSLPAQQLGELGHDALAADAALSSRLEGIDAAASVIASADAQRHELAGIELPAGIDEATSSALRQAVGLSFVSGFRWVVLLCSALALLSASSAWLLVDGKASVRQAPGWKEAPGSLEPSSTTARDESVAPRGIRGGSVDRAVIATHPSSRNPTFKVT